MDKLDLKQAVEKEQVLLDKTDADLNVDLKMTNYKNYLEKMAHWLCG